jgi:hypothetical protein
MPQIDGQTEYSVRRALRIEYIPEGTELPKPDAPSDISAKIAEAGSKEDRKLLRSDLWSEEILRKSGLSLKENDNNV